MAQLYGFEKLYLAKEKDGQQDVYVEKCPLVQHQLDGIRFLYRAWIKKRLGVILNDPSSYGKRVQTTLFLSAVLPLLLHKAVLILCREGNEQVWINHFQTWTQVSRDVVKELTNPFTKKKVLIVPTYAAAAFARREWALLVVDDDLNKELVKSPLRADLKVWVTTANIKKDLSRFSTFFSWVHPKEKFNGDVFKADERDLRDVLAKDAVLDAYMEDLLLRRSNLELPYTCRTQVPVTSNILEPIVTVTKKNKDITGTKIKRTKRKTVDKSEDAPRKVAETINNVNNMKNSEVFEMGIINISNLDVSKGLAIHDSSDDDYDTLSIMNKRKKKSKLRWDSDSDSEIPANKPYADSGNIDNEITQSTIEFDINTDEKSPIVNNSLEISGQTNVFRLESDTDVSDEDLPKKINIGANNEKNIKESATDAKIDNNEITNMLQDTYELEIDEIVDTKYSEDLFPTDFTTANEINKRKADQVIAEIPPKVNDKSVCENTGILPSKSIETRSNRSTEHRLSETIENPEELRNGTENIKPLKNASLSEFDLKMKQLEEMALKKFKGSFLDSIL